MSRFPHWFPPHKAEGAYSGILSRQYDIPIPAIAFDAVHIPHIGVLHSRWLEVINAINHLEAAYVMPAFKRYKEAGGVLDLYELGKYVVEKGKE